jgi:Flp pilus assembly protein TadG
MSVAQALRRAARLAGDKAGTAAVEFAALLPVLLTLFIGAYESANLLLAYHKLESSAETVAGLIAEVPAGTVVLSSGSGTGWDFGNITAAGDQVMTPFPTTGLKVAYASVTYSTGAAVIDWHLELNGATAINIAALPDDVQTANLGTASSGSSSSFIVAQLTYPYTSPVSNFLSTAYNLTVTSYNRPRYVNCVPSYLNTTPSTCASTPSTCTCP